MKAAAMLFVLAFFLSAPLVHAHGPGHESESILGAPLWIWGLGLALLACAAAILYFQAKRGRLGGERFRGFSRNAKLLLIRSPFSGLSVSLLRLLFNLYLLAVGFDLLFVAKFAAINWTFHGLSVIPAGILSDLFGRRRVFLISYAGNLLTTTAIIFVTDPQWLLILAGVIGFFEGGHAIVGPPFMVEQSRPSERVNLFSLNGGIQVAAASIGNLAAGVLPLAFASMFHVGPESEWARRAALLCAIPIMFCSVIPIYLIKEEWKPIDIRRWFKDIENYPRIGMLALTEGLIGLGLGFSAPFFNVFFEQHLKASTLQIGVIFATASVLTAIATIFIPYVVGRLGRVRTVTFVKLLGLPALILLGMSHDIVWAGVFYVLAILFIGGPYPNKGISDPIYTLFAMEVVKERERGTTNGIMHAFVEFPMGIGAGLAGSFMAVGDWQSAYMLGGAIFGLAFIFYYLYFARLDVPEATLEPVTARSRA
jgi:MFS family permease